MLRNLDSVRVIKFASLVVLSMGLNEFLLLYFHSRFIGAMWALVCMWILFDGILVAAQLTQSEKSLKEMELRCNAMQAELLVQSNTILNKSDNFLLLCELRQRVILQGHRMKEYHRAVLAASSPN